MKIDNDDYWNNYFLTNFVYDPRRDVLWKEVCSFLQKRYVPIDSKILDLGTGYCNFINNIRGSEKHALDIWNKASEYAHKDVKLHIQSCTKLDIFRNDSFDVVFASNLFEHLTREDLSDTLHELVRVLTPLGKLIALQPNFRYCYKGYFDDYTHQQVFTDRGLAELLLSYGLNLIDVKPRFLPVNMKTTLRFPLPKLGLILRAYLRSAFKPLASQMLIVAEKPHKNK